MEVINVFLTFFIQVTFFKEVFHIFNFFSALFILKNIVKSKSVNMQKSSEKHS